MADNDNDEGARAAPSAKETAPDPSAGGVILELAASRSDKHEDNLEVLMADTYDLAHETLTWIKREDYDSDARDVLVKQGTALVGSYAKLVATSDRHRKAMREKD